MPTTYSTADVLDLMNRLAERTRQFEQSQAQLADALRRLDEIRKVYCWQADEPQAIGLTEAEWIKRSRQTLARQRDDALSEVQRLLREIKEVQAGWKFVPDQHGGHMLASGPGLNEKWYPESFINEQVEKRLKERHDTP